MKSLTRTFVSDGATSTVTTVFHKKGEADADGKVWGAVKKLEKEHGKMKAEIDAKSTILIVRTKQKNSTQPAGASSTGASGASPVSPVDKKLKALEEELYGKSGASGSESGASGPDADSGSSGASGASGSGQPVNGVTDSNILRLIASRMDGMGTPKGGSGAAEPQNTW